MVCLAPQWLSLHFPKLHVQSYVPVHVDENERSCFSAFFINQISILCGRGGFQTRPYVSFTLTSRAGRMKRGASACSGRNLGGSALLEPPYVNAHRPLLDLADRVVAVLCHIEVGAVRGNPA